MRQFDDGQHVQSAASSWGLSIEPQLIKNIKGVVLEQPNLKVGEQQRPFEDYSKMKVKIAQPIKL
jgi:hypothetical protein